jgi:C4-dicarboxylate transporter DctM subunit
MSPETIGIIGVILLVVLLFSRMWIGAAMTLIGFIGYAYLRGIEPAFAVLGQIPYTTVAYYPISAVPLFLLMGVVIANTQMGDDMYLAAHKWVGHYRGGLAIATIIACAIFAAITGSSLAGAATMGKIAVPQMKKYNYNMELATGCVACAGTLAILIPPSLIFILYGILTENSVGQLFMAGFLPGLLLSSLFVVTVAIITARNPKAGPPGPKSSFREKMISLKSLWHTLILIFLVLGGIYAGIITPTEAGGIGACGALIINAVTRRLTLRRFLDSILEASMTTAMIMLLMVGAFVFMKFLAISRLPFLLSQTIAALTVPPSVILIGVIILYILLGMFLDVISAVVLTVPILYPSVVAMGYDPIWFGVIIVLLVEMGVVTPPVGINVYVLGPMVNVPLGVIFKGIVPFCVAIIVCIIMLIIFPQIALFLPSTMG